MCVQSCPTLCNPMDCIPPDSPVHEITQVGILEWVAISSSRVSTQSMDQICVSWIGRQILHHWTTGKPVCLCMSIYVNHNHRKLTKLVKWITALSDSMKLWAMPCRVLKTDRSWWRVLTKWGPLEKGMANHFSVLALRTPWTVWKGKKIGHQVSRCPICYGRTVEK